VDKKPEFAAVSVIPGPRSGTRNPEAWITKVKCTTGEISLKSNSYMPTSEYNRDLPISGFAGSATRPRNDEASGISLHFASARFFFSPTKGGGEGGAKRRMRGQSDRTQASNSSHKAPQNRNQISNHHGAQPPPHRHGYAAPPHPPTTLGQRGAPRSEIYLNNTLHPTKDPSPSRATPAPPLPINGARLNRDRTDQFGRIRVKHFTHDRGCYSL
jgi:hypothetical protein